YQERRTLLGRLFDLWHCGAGLHHHLGQHGPRGTGADLDLHVARGYRVLEVLPVVTVDVLVDDGLRHRAHCQAHVGERLTVVADGDYQAVRQVDGGGERAHAQTGNASDALDALAEVYDHHRVDGRIADPDHVGPGVGVGAVGQLGAAFVGVGECRFGGQRVRLAKADRDGLGGGRRAFGCRRYQFGRDGAVAYLQLGDHGPAFTAGTDVDLDELAVACPLFVGPYQGADGVVGDVTLQVGERHADVF